MSVYTVTYHSVQYNPDGTSIGWGGFGNGLIDDGSDANGVYYDSGFAPAPFAISFDSVDLGAIPLSSTVSSVVQNMRARVIDTLPAVTPYIRYSGGAKKYGSALSLTGSFAAYTQTYATDPNNATWTVANFFLARYGVEGAAAVGTVYWSELSQTINFTLPAPTGVTTDAASAILGNSATLNGTFNPAGATSTFPCSYYFEWGLTAAYGNTTATVGGQTGSSPVAASNGITGLTVLTTYHYRIVVINGDNTVTGADRTFTTNSTIIDSADDGEEG
jgi:hypothetical protein